jgi:hypothetical protein
MPKILESVIPPKDGRYYVKTISHNGEISKCCEAFRDGKWQLGSGHFVIAAVIEILDDAEDLSTPIKHQSK